VEDRFVRLLFRCPFVRRHFRLPVLHSWPQCATLRRGLPAVGSVDLRRFLPGHGAALATATGEKTAGHHAHGCPRAQHTPLLRSHPRGTRARTHRWHSRARVEPSVNNVNVTMTS